MRRQKIDPAALADAAQTVANGWVMVAEARAMRIADLEAQVAVARTGIAYAAESSTVTTSDNPGCFWCDHEEHTEKCWVPGWLARTAPKEPNNG